jgi:ribosomal protein L29
MELLEEILSRKNLNDAYLQVFKNKGASGVDGVSVEQLYEYIKEHKEELLELQENISQSQLEGYKSLKTMVKCVTLEYLL